MPCSSSAQDRRGRQKQLTYVGTRAMLIYELPLNEVVFDFYDRLKSVSRGYASFDYQIKGYEETTRQALGARQRRAVDALSMIVHRTRAEKPRPRHVREAERADPRRTCSRSPSRRRSAAR